MPEAAQLYHLTPVEAPWGDYGHVLAHGMSTSFDRLKGLIQLERTGPSIAPITFPGAGDIVVTQAFQIALERSGLTGFSFQPVIKRHIVDLDWEEWDLTADGPEVEPEAGEPENYILARPHEMWVSDELGILLELVLEPGVEAHIGADKILRVQPETWNGADFFQAAPYRIPCVSAKARDWLKNHAGDYVEFRELAPA
jgi:hypothetical protein